MEQYITLDERGVLWLKDTNTKVVEVMLDYLVHGWSVEEIRCGSFGCGCKDRSGESRERGPRFPGSQGDP